jgi:DMSO/TMAO reductase YedYZ heme-binding membrane subunit
LIILAIMTITSMDWVIHVMHFKNWKLLHRLVYFAGIAILIHVIIIGPHYTVLSLLGVLTYGSIVFLVVLEGVRIKRAITSRTQKAIMK